MSKRKADDRPPARSDKPYKFDKPFGPPTVSNGPRQFSNNLPRKEPEFQSQTKYRREDTYVPSRFRRDVDVYKPPKMFGDLEEEEEKPTSSRTKLKKGNEVLIPSRSQKDDGRLKYDMIEITCNDRLGKKVRIKCRPDDKIGDLKKLVAAQTGTHWSKIILKKWYIIYKDHVSLEDYEIHDGQNLELYYQ